MTQKSMPFSVLGKPTGPVCNLSCKYCFYLEKEQLYSGSVAKCGWMMSDAVLDSYIRQYIESQDTPAVSFAWQGGEPTLLGVEYFTKILRLQEKYAGGKRIENSLQTNGVLLDDHWCEFMAGRRFLVGVSIDGPRELHDKFRVDRAGAPTFDRVSRGIELLKKHGVEFNTLTAVQRDNARHPLAVYRFLREVGSGFLQFIPVVERIAACGAQGGAVLTSPDSSVEAAVAPWSVDPAHYGRFLCAVFDEWVRHDVGRVYVQQFEMALGSWAGLPPSVCVFREACGDALVVEHNGDVYSCDHYVYPRNRLGNVLETPLAEMAASPRQRAFGQAKAELSSVCLECRFLFACGGDCPKHRFVRTSASKAGLSYLCPAYKRFFGHVNPYMEFMAGALADQRPPASVMDWARERDVVGSGDRQAGRNAVCPCGSGRKFKNCSGSGVAHWASLNRRPS